MSRSPRLLCWLLAGAPSAFGAPSLTLDLAALPPGTTVTRVHGHGGDYNGLAGVPVCGGFDGDGDGHRDVAFANFQAEVGGRPLSGEVTVAFGDGTVGTTLDSAVPQPGILLINGGEINEALGSEVWMDDLTGDGLGDLLIARQNYSLPGVPTQRGAGALTVLVGGPGWRTQAATLTPLDVRSPPAHLQLVTFVGPSAYDRLGIWMRAGDLTGDGIADLVVGADEVDADGAAVSQNQGAVFVVRGGPHLLDSPPIVDLATFGTPAFPANLEGHVARIDAPANAANYHLGATLQVGDLDGNGRAEVFMAATVNRAGAGLRLTQAPAGTGQAVGGAPDGAVFIVWDENFPPGPWPAGFRFRVDDPPFGDYTRIDGDLAAEAFGEELIGGLDFSGDGFAELMVGDLVADPFNRFNAGRGYIFYNAGNLRGLDFKLNLNSLPPGVAVTTIAGPRARAISSDTVLQGDFDGDGIGDLGIGNPHDDPFGRADAGSIHVLYGQPGGWPLSTGPLPSIDLAPGNLPDPATMRIALVAGANGPGNDGDGDTLCYSATSGDLNGDGRPELIVNEMAGDGAGGTPIDIGNLIAIDPADLLPPFLPSLTATPAGPVAFGTVQVTGGTGQRSVTLTNTSGSPLTLFTVFVGGPAAADFTILSDSGEGTLAPGASRTLEIRFDPAVVGRSGAALFVGTGADPHPVTIGLTGRGVDDSLADPTVLFRLEGSDALFEIPDSQFGTDYTLYRDPTLGSPTPLRSLPGNGHTLYFSDPGAADTFDAMLYRLEAGRP